eukprot:19123-Heterococcus_DN1.PRE.2
MHNIRSVGAVLLLVIAALLCAAPALSDGDCKCLMNTGNAGADVQVDGSIAKPASTLRGRASCLIPACSGTSKYAAAAVKCTEANACGGIPWCASDCPKSAQLNEPCSQRGGICVPNCSTSCAEICAVKKESYVTPMQCHAVMGDDLCAAGLSCCNSGGASAKPSEQMKLIMGSESGMAGMPGMRR